MDALSTDKLRQRCDPASLPFATTEELAEHTELIGQSRALDAIRLSSQMPHRDFNLFVIGSSGTGRHTAVLKVLGNEAAKRQLPTDWVYVNNFEAAHRPRALCLPAGTAPKLKRTMQNLVDDLGSDIPALFESEEYQIQRRTIDQELGEAQEAAMADFADRAKAEDIAFLRTPMGFLLTAIRNGELVKSEDYQKLDEHEQAEIDEKIVRLQEDLAAVLRQGPKLEKEHRKRVEELNAKMAERAVSARVAEVEPELQDIEVVAEYLEKVREDIISNAELYLDAAAQADDGPFPEAIRKFHRDPMFDRYVVNVMVPLEGETREGAPVVTEDLPTLDRVTGRIEHLSHMGSLMTNFTMIRPGALHRANGGYLVLDARRILSEPYAWDALKRCLKNKAITITSMAERLSLVSTTSLEPDPIPLNLRVVLIGDRLLYALLVLLDPEFSELFKLQADFEDVVDRTGENLIQIARLVGSFAVCEGLRPMTAAGVARLLDEATRLADDSRKLSLRLGALSDFVREADHYAANRNSDLIDYSDIELAVTERERRASRIKDQMQEAITRKTVLIDTDGEQVGQINGLAVVGLGDYRFGRPSRITARARMGAGKLVDIEREVELGGPLHSKGVMILSGYLTSTYALDVPFSLHASLVFEQSYGGIDGDSASSAELYALLSALSGCPIRQGFAVTGSVNQTGEVQAIGGVNEKIEGFFEICATHGLTGDQGVLIPKANVEHLMLRSNVIDAAKAGKFRVIPVETIDQGIAILTGVEAGARDDSGVFPTGTVNAKVEDRLRGFAESRRAFARPVGSDTDGPGK